MSASDIYKEIILDYYRRPRNYGKLDEHQIEAHDTNPLCGDEVDMQVKVGNGGTMEKVMYTGKGCAISQASASMLTELAEGKSLEWVKQLSKDDVIKMLGNPELGPARIKCALLGMKVLKTGVYGYLGAELDNKED